MYLLSCKNFNHHIFLFYNSYSFSLLPVLSPPSLIFALSSLYPFEWFNVFVLKSPLQLSYYPQSLGSTSLGRWGRWPFLLGVYLLVWGKIPWQPVCPGLWGVPTEWFIFASCWALMGFVVPDPIHWVLCESRTLTRKEPGIPACQGQPSTSHCLVASAADSAVPMFPELLTAVAQHTPSSSSPSAQSFWFIPNTPPKPQNHSSVLT